MAGAVAGPRAGAGCSFLLAALGVPVALGLAAIREPRRGRNEMRAVLGEELATDAGELPVSVGVAFERLRKIRSFHDSSWPGWRRWASPSSASRCSSTSTSRTTSASPPGSGASSGRLVACPASSALAVVGPRGRPPVPPQPPAAWASSAGSSPASACSSWSGLFMPNVWLLGAFYAVGVALSQAAFVTVVSVTSSVIPYRLRSRGTAMVGVYVFLFGGFFGAVLTGLLTDALGRRGALTPDRPAGRP